MTCLAVRELEVEVVLMKESIQVTYVVMEGNRYQVASCYPVGCYALQERFHVNVGVLP